MPKARRGSPQPLSSENACPLSDDPAPCAMQRCRSPLSNTLVRGTSQTLSAKLPHENNSPQMAASLRADFGDKLVNPAKAISSSHYRHWRQPLRSALFVDDFDEILRGRRGVQFFAGA